MGLVLGLPVLRVRGDYLAVITLGFGEIIRQLANNLDKPLNLTNGPQGITPIQRPTLPEGVLHLLQHVLRPLVGHQVTGNQFYNILFYLIALLVVVAVIVVTYRLEDSKIGRAWTAIREDELAAQAMGIPANRLKLGAFAVGASFAGAMGVLFAASRTFVSPETFTFLQSVGVLTMVILGGIGSITGVIIGATVVTCSTSRSCRASRSSSPQLRQSDAVIPIINFHWKDLSNQLDPSKYQRLMFGIILVLMMIYRPAGISRRPGASASSTAARRRRAMPSRQRKEPTMLTTIILKTEDVVKRFGGLTAVNEMSFAIEAGSICRIIGPNGAGKTTFFNAITASTSPTRASIEFEGKAHRPASSPTRSPTGASPAPSRTSACSAT